jgi:hypothetical protein
VGSAISFSDVFLHECRADIEALLSEQWAETGDSEIECKPDWALYSKLTKEMALLVVARDEEATAIGYCVGIIHKHFNSIDRKVATISTFFVKNRPQLAHPGLDRALNLRAMLEFAVKVAFKRGVWKVNVKTEYNHSCGRLLEAMGFVPKAVEYVLTQEMRHA